MYGHIRGDLTTRAGHHFMVRPVNDRDEPALCEFFAHVTPEDLRFRFLTGVNVVGHDRLAAMIRVDHDRSETFLAFADDGVTVIAAAVLVCDSALEVGEVAISIRPDYKKRGISWALLAHVARYADIKGVGTLQSIESYANHAAIELEREMGFTARTYPGDSTLMLVERKLPLAAAA